MPGACLRAAAALAWAAAIAVQPAPGQEPPAPRIGVALSGGAARGLAHIGVLEGLEELGVPIHVVSGTSMGALVGGFYAAGYDAHTLGALVRRVDWATVLSDRVDRRFLDPEQKLDDGRHLFTLPIRGWVPTLPDRLVSGHNVRQLVARLVWPVATVRDFRDLPLPFAAVATDLETGEAVVFASGNLADALSASMAIPGVFPPATLGGRLLVDGGLVRNLPARDARDLGAEVLICSDVTEPLKPAAEIATVLDVLSQAYRLLSVLAHAEDRAGCDVVIEPDLGGLTGSDFDQVDEWIARGRRAVEEVRDRLDALASREPHRSRPRPPAHPYVVDSVVTFGLEGPDARVARSRLGLTVPGPVTTDDLAAGLDRLYASGAYDQLGYRLDPRPGTDTARLVLRATRATPAELGFGIRYDQRYKASLLFTATLRDRLGAGSVAAVDLRAGEQARLAGSYTRRFGGVTPWLVGARLGYERLPFDLYDAGDRIGEARSHVIGGTLFVGRSLGTAVLAGVTATLEHARTAAAPAGPLAPDEELALVGAGATAVVDTRDRRRLPTRGVHVRARAEWARRDSGSSRGFAQHVVHAAAALPISGAVSLLGRVAAGASFGAALPEHHRFRLGGAVPYYLSPHRHVEFLGLRPHERSGRALQVVGAGAQVRLARDLHARLQWNGGAVLETWALDLDEWVHGAGVTLAAGIAGGLGSATLAAGAIEGPWRFDFEVGFPF